ncbi:DUF3883 domain-containing protein [Salisaeta longa]|uniref:DUF3883 domain-containing protein n=1 Tax=Salisaeta longa TaxID=503170 RepID=UPI000421BFF4|nr:DUF3883 domain-containing protein [Salisaeta longa]
MKAMDDCNALALVVAYYISRFDAAAYERLGRNTKKSAHRAVGQALGVKASTVKNMRDEFDPLHDNPRKGWHKRDLRPSRQKIVEMFGEMDEEGLYDVVRGILQDPTFRDADDVQEVVREVIETDKKPVRESASPASRMKTGRMAEDFFIDFHAETNRPAPGLLHDRRYHACGYDFEIQDSSATTFVEVKGMAEQSGGILFTDKEWRVASQKSGAYVVALVRNLVATPDVSFIWNPTASLEPKQRLYTTIRRSWTVPGAQLS